MTDSTNTPDVLHAVDCDIDDIPDIGMSGKDVRYWLRENDSDTPLPAPFNTMVSIATHPECAPYINQTGTWPDIVAKWCGWAWEHNYQEAAVRLVKCALYNTNAHADQSKWLTLYQQSNQHSKSAMQQAFTEVLPEALHSSAAYSNKKNFFRNMESILEGAESWCTPDCIAEMSDEHVLRLAEKPCKPDAIFEKVLTAWLNDEAHGQARFEQWVTRYREKKDSDAKDMALALASCLHGVTPVIRKQAYTAVQATDEHRVLFYQATCRGWIKRRHESPPASDLVAALSAIAEEPVELKTFDAKTCLVFKHLRSQDVWTALDSQAQRRLALLVAVAIHPHDNSWAPWCNAIATNNGLPQNLFSLLESLEVTSWPQLVASHEATRVQVALPDLTVGGDFSP